MGRTDSKEIAEDFLKFAFSPAVAIQDKHSPAASLAANTKMRLSLWHYIRDNFDTVIYPTLSDNMVVLERFLQLSLKQFASFDVLQEINDFFKNKDCRGFDRGLRVASDTITGNAKYRARDEAVVQEWLKAHGYI
jgi:ABC-type glycerol-3-phosphate transport system substrate-binding protein